MKYASEEIRKFHRPSEVGDWRWRAGRKRVDREEALWEVHRYPAATEEHGPRKEAHVCNVLVSVDALSKPWFSAPFVLLGN